MICITCSKNIVDNSLFCSYCGEKVQKELSCGHCGAILTKGSVFCNICGAKLKIKEFVPDAEAALAKVGSLVIKESTLRFSKKVKEEDKTAVKKLRKLPHFLLYDKEENIVYLKRDNLYIEAFQPMNPQNSTVKYKLPENVNLIWSRYGPKKFYFYHNSDAFLAWDDYIFISVYNGQIKWAATDDRDEHYLQGRKADVYLYASGAPELEFLANGNIKSGHFYGGKECRVDKGVLIPIE